MAVATEKWSFAAPARLGKIRIPLEEDDMDVDVVLGRGNKRRRRGNELMRRKKRMTGCCGQKREEMRS